MPLLCRLGGRRRMLRKCCQSKEGGGATCAFNASEYHPTYPTVRKAKKYEHLSSRANLHALSRLCRPSKGKFVQTLSIVPRMWQINPPKPSFHIPSHFRRKWRGEYLQQLPRQVREFPREPSLFQCEQLTKLCQYQRLADSSLLRERQQSCPRARPWSVQDSLPRPINVTAKGAPPSLYRRAPRSR